MPRYIAIEVGDSAYTEFKMKDGEFHLTEDGIYLGDVEAKDKDDAYRKIKRLEWNRGRVFHKVLIFEVKKEWRMVEF